MSNGTVACTLASNLPSTNGLRGTPLIAILVFASATWGQEDPGPRYRDELVVTEVLLDVLVTDRHGRVILGLGRDDFLVDEDGESIEVTGLTFYSSRRLWSSAGEPEGNDQHMQDSPEVRYFILFFQQQLRAGGEVPGLLARQLMAARDCGQWIERELLPGDFVSVVAYDTHLSVVQDFTRDPRKLKAAVTNAALGKDAENDWPSRRPDAATDPSLLAALPSGRALSRQTEDIYAGLQILSRAASRVRGRKILVFLGRGIGEIGGVAGWQPDPRHYRPTVEALNDSNIAVYPLDLMPPGARHTLEASLDALAADTGGEHRRQFNSFLTPLREISNANSGYYLLSYASRRARGEDGFQRVRVKARNPEFRVRARRGYLYGE